VSGATKNAIDYLYNEWIGKPILIVTYGIMGGTNASEQLKTILTGMKLKVVETRPALGFAGGQGPDLWAASAGQLGEASRTAWTENNAELLKGFSELQAALKSE
jgi:NAD(P)H-dependent FMN reductase